MRKTRSQLLCSCLSESNETMMNSDDGQSTSQQQEEEEQIVYRFHYIAHKLRTSHLISPLSLSFFLSWYKCKSRSYSFYINASTASHLVSHPGAALQNQSNMALVTLVSERKWSEVRTYRNKSGIELKWCSVSPLIYVISLFLLFWETHIYFYGGMSDEDETCLDFWRRLLREDELLHKLLPSD